MRIKEDAELLLLGLTTGYATVEEVIDWADKVITDYDSPPIEVLEISALEGVDDTIVKLRKMKGEYDWSVVFARFLGLLHRKLLEDRTKARQMVNRLYLLMIEYREKLPEEIEHSIYYFDDGYDLASNGVYGDINDLTDEFLDFLKKYKDI